jgi:hypothetical protein
MDELLREMHHCVRNNFQIIASLINLQKRMLPAERRGEMRFVEEHVQSMAVVYRVSDSRGNLRVPINRLVIEIVDNLRHIAGLTQDAVKVSAPETEESIEQKYATALALFLAVVLPPYFEQATAHDGPFQVTVTPGPSGSLTLAVAEERPTITLDPLRQRLATAYLRQLVGTHEQSKSGIIVRFPLEH